MPLMLSWNNQRLKLFCCYFFKAKHSLNRWKWNSNNPKGTQILSLPNSTWPNLILLLLNYNNRSTQKSNRILPLKFSFVKKRRRRPEDVSAPSGLIVDLLASWGSGSKQVHLGTFTLVWKLLCVLSGDASNCLENRLTASLWQLWCCRRLDEWEEKLERFVFDATKLQYLLSAFCTWWQDARPLALKYMATDFPVCSNDM